MLETILDRHIIFVLMGILTAVGIMSKCIANVTLKRLIRAAGNMNKSNHPLMRLVRAKFEHVSMISDKVENVRVFVDKYLYEYKVLGVRLHGWRRTEKAAAGLCLLAGAAGAGLEYSVNGMNSAVWKNGAIGGGLAAFIFLVHLMTDEKYQMEAVRNYMVDYLENVCRHRYEKEKTYQKGIKVLAQEGTAAEFGVMPDEEYRPDDVGQEEDREKADWKNQAAPVEKIDRIAQTEKTEWVEKTEQRVRPEELEEADIISEARTRRPEGGKSAVSTFHAAERIADEAINTMLAAKGRQVSQSEAMGAVLKAEAKRGEAVKESVAELPAAEFVRETMEPKKRETQDKPPKKEKPGQELDRDLVIRRILEEFMA